MVMNSTYTKKAKKLDMKNEAIALTLLQVRKKNPTLSKVCQHSIQTWLIPAFALSVELNICYYTIKNNELW